MESRGPAVLAVTAAMIAVATVFVFFRMVSRFAVVRRVTLEDWFMLAAWVIAFGLSFCICYAVKFGLGQHQKTIPVAERETLERLEYTFSVLYNPALMATKTSICLFYLTLCRTRPIIKWATIGTMVVVNVAGLALSLLNIFQCRPISALFKNPTPEGAVCIDIITLYLSSAPVNIITDLAILLLPMPLLKGMNLPKKQKIILHITFGFGVFVTAVDVVRIAYLQEATLNRLQELHHNDSRPNGGTQTATDFSWYASLSFMWSAIEVNVGIMCACVPALKPLVARFLPKLLKDSSQATPEKRPSAAALSAGDTSSLQRVPSMPMNSAASPQHSTSAEPVEELGFTEFLTTPDMTEIPQMQRTDTVQANFSSLTRTGTNFQFMDMREQKSIVYMTNRESVRPIAHVTVLFFLWGFAYGLLNTLNGQFEEIANMSVSQSVALHSAYFVGYFFGPLTVGRIVLKRWGFKACYMVGLIIYGTGALVFWPSAVLTSFAAFFVSNFIVGYGLSILEVAANPFIALCGPPEYAEARLNLSQAIQACGTVVSPLLAKKALFKNILDAPSLVDVQWTYLAITLFTFLLAFAYYCVKLPEVSDEELEDASYRTHPDTLDSLRKKNIIWITLGLAVFAQFLYVGAQEGVATALDNYLLTVKPDANPVNYEAVGHTLFAASRFIAAFAGLFFKSRHLLLFFFIGAIVFSALSMHFTGVTSAVMLLMVLFFEGPLFSFIFALPLHALGKYTKDGSVLITAAISGGGVIAPIQNAVTSGHGVQYSFCVAVACFSVGTLFPLYLNLVPDARLQVDPRKKEDDDMTSTGGSNGTLSGLAFLRRRRKSPSLEKEPFDKEPAITEHTEVRDASI